MPLIVTLVPTMPDVGVIVIDGTTDSVAVLVYTPSVAVIVWEPAELSGIVNEVENLAALFVLVEATCVLSNLIVTVRLILNPVPVIVTWLPITDEDTFKLMVEVTTKEANAFLVPDCTQTVYVPAGIAGTVKELVIVPADEVVPVFTIT